jgi:Uma2 family endonuclease
MTAAKHIELITVEEYLAGELLAKRKHEYSAGRVYAMAGGRNAHNSVATTFLGAMHTRLRGKPCQPFNSGTKVRVRLTSHTRFYYPDAMVVCEPNRAATRTKTGLWSSSRSSRLARAGLMKGRSGRRTWRSRPSRRT